MTGPASSATAQERGAAGFSFVELLFVLLVVAILLGIALPQWHRTIVLNRLNMAAVVLVQDLRAAQAQARAAREDFQVVFTAGGAQYLVTRGVGDLVQVVDLPDDVTVSSTVQVVFDPWGRVPSAYTVTIGDVYGRTKQIEVTADGQIHQAP
jgi:Tfp pilus assembly protein FimT